MAGLHVLDWAILVGYFAAMLWIGVRCAGRASRSLDEYFLSGRSLPWWLAGTSMVATSFSCDTPLLVSGWVRDYGLWKNWAWWCYAVSGCLQVFLFARWWRRAEVMTKAELVELRYGGAGARILRGTLGTLHAVLTNTLIMAWVLLAASKISEALFAVDKTWSLALACVVAAFYSITAGLWGVVMTDLVQFVLAMVGASVLGVIAWELAGGTAGAHAAALAGRIPAETLALFPPSGPGSFLDASFWSVSLAAACVYLGVSWWAVESVDGASAAVQRIAASRNEREGLLAMLWFNVAHYALRPWFWIVVGLASLLLLPTIEVRAPHAGTLHSVDARALVLLDERGNATEIALDATPAEPDWRPAPAAGLAPGARVAEGQVLARTDSESAYVVLLKRYLPVGLLGLAVASLVAAFMSTIDTHMNLAASFFVNDVYRRFWRKDGSTDHHILVARLASAGSLGIGALIAAQTDSIRDLFLYFVALLGGVGPVYLLRWVWWRVRASTELAAMAASVLATFVLTPHGGWVLLSAGWPAGPLAPGGELTPEGRVLLVVAFSLLAALGSLLVTRAPDPRALVDFYRRVRPIGAWGPVRALCPDVAPPREIGAALAGSAGGLALVYGLMLAPAGWLLERPGVLAAALASAALGGLLVAAALRRLTAGR
jgi:Na+/proline symporter